MKKFLIANWKMNTDFSQAVDLADYYKSHLKKVDSLTIVVCPPAIWLAELSKRLSKSSIGLGAQNIHYQEFGAVTGEISAIMVKKYAKYVIVGHSERRKIFEETNEAINQKVRQALKHNLVPIICFGENVKEEGIDHILAQISFAIKGVSHEDIKKVIFAYEPVWAIGTGQPASAHHAWEMIDSARERLAIIYNREIATKTKFLYGGSVNAKNIQSFLQETTINGFLVGGASLDHKSFEVIYNELTR